MDMDDLRAHVGDMKHTATMVVRRHAAIYTRDVPIHDVDAICNALGEISIDEATAVLDRLQREAEANGADGRN